MKMCSNILTEVGTPHKFQRNKSGSELTLFSHVTRTRRTRRRRTPPNFTLQEGFTGLYIREGERVGVRRVSGRYLEGVWRVSGRCLEGVWKVSGRCLEGVICSEIKFFQDPNFFRTQNLTKIFRT